MCCQSFSAGEFFSSTGSDHFNFCKINYQFFSTVFASSVPSCLCFSRPRTLFPQGLIFLIQVSLRISFRQMYDTKFGVRRLVVRLFMVGFTVVSLCLKESLALPTRGRFVCHVHCLVHDGAVRSSPCRPHHENFRRNLYHMFVLAYFASQSIVLF